MRLLIGVDDTDDLTSRGTGYRIRVLATELAESGYGRPRGITRHQLLVDDRIPYTSHNSAAALTVDAEPVHQEAIVRLCREHLIRESAQAADVGLCVAEWSQIGSGIRDFGARAKTSLLTQQDAWAEASAGNVGLWGLTGSRDGVIGALAAVGLRAAGNDGRFLWLPGLRELTGCHPVERLRTLAGIASVRTMSGVELGAAESVDVGDWPRPLLLNGEAVLLVEEGDSDAGAWRAVERDRIKQLSN